MAKKKNNDWINKQLRFALANALGKSETQITKEYLSSLNELDLSEMGLNDLYGIQYAKNLVSINLSKNKLIDVKPLNALKKLTNLELCENKIEDVSFLNELVNLESIGLDGNNISSIPDLNNLNNLNVINISNNKILDLSFIKTLRSSNVKIIASEQCVLLTPISIEYGEDYTFKPYIIWDEETKIYCDNVQVTGSYKALETDERPSFLYSISKMLIRNICSDCVIKAEFYHEVPYAKSGILSGILIQPILVKLANLTFDLSKLKKDKTPGKIYGRLELDSNSLIYKRSYSSIIKGKTVTLIDSKGQKISCLTNNNGEYKFNNLDEGRYTLLFPFINECEYSTPSLFICNLREGEFIEINSKLKSI